MHRPSGDIRRTSPAPPRLAGIDVLRGVAILSVVFFHVLIVRPFAGPWWIRWVGQGAEGVGLFFLISAWSLAASWRYRAGRDRRPVRSFWARRFWRIAPMYYLLLVVTGIFTRGKSNVAPAAMRANPHTWPSFLAHVTFVFGWLPAFQNSWIGVEWSIGAEATFYLLFPWLVGFLQSSARAAWGLLATIALAWMWPYLLTHWPGVSWPRWAGGFFVWAFPAQAFWFVAGLWIAALTSRADLPKRPVWWGWGVLWILTAGIAASYRWNPMMGNLVWLLPNMLLLALTVRNASGLRILTQNRVLRYVGQRSYSLYLVHWVVLQSVVMRYVPAASPSTVTGFLVRAGITLPLSLLLSEVGYRWVEQPGLAWGRRWIARHLNGPEAPVSAGRETRRAST